VRGSRVRHILTARTRRLLSRHCTSSARWGRLSPSPAAVVEGVAESARSAGLDVICSG
jgi:hypothetical protein